MFTQIENPFGAIISVSYSTITEYTSYNESSNIWKWILAIFALIGGFIVFLVWNETSKENHSELEDKNKPSETQKLDEMNS